MTSTEKLVLGLIILLLGGGGLISFISAVNHDYDSAKTQERNDLVMRYCIEAGHDPIDCACDAYRGGICDYDK